MLGLVVAWAIIDRATKHSRKPEWLIAIGWMASASAIAIGTLLTGEAHSPAKSWLLVAAISLPARFHKRGLYAGVAFTLILLALVTVVADARAVADEPQLLVFPAALIVAGTVMCMALREAEIQHRSEAVIDELTGMLNRKASRRARSSSSSSRASGSSPPPVATAG